jgi:long-chain fatty acid transport protein
MRFWVGCLCLAGLAAYLPSGQGFAAGFALRETSATGQGNAFAGATASAEDISFMANNPAGLTRHPGQNFSATATAIVAKAEFSKSLATLNGGGTISGSNGGKDAAVDSLVPAVYYAHQLSPEWFAGVSLTVPFGLASKYDPTWVGRYYSIKSDLRTFNFNPVVAYKATPELSIGGGVQVAYTRGKLTNAVDFGTVNSVLSLGVGGATPGAVDGFAELEGDDLAFGYNLGALYEFRPGTRIGLAYRSEIHHRLKGEERFFNSSVGNTISGLTGAFKNTVANVDLTLPESVSAGIHHELTPQLAVMAEVAWTAWSRVRELRVKFDNSSQSDDVTASHWRDTMFYAVGLTYKPDDTWTWRTGLAFDKSPIPDAYRTPRIPDEDRFWVSFGGRYQITSKSYFDFGYTHLFFKDASLLLSTSGTGNSTRGNLRGSYEVGVDVLAVQYHLAF